MPIFRPQKGNIAATPLKTYVQMEKQPMTIANNLFSELEKEVKTDFPEHVIGTERDELEAMTAPYIRQINQNLI